MSSSIISTDKAKCRDCYRCVRMCPVKAIRISDGQAQVDGDRCINCGTCVRECPQKAKHVRKDIEKVIELINSKSKLVASVAPSFPAAFPELETGKLASAIRKLGFEKVTETAVGAEMVAKATADILKDAPEDTWVTSSCPVVVNLVEKYYPNSCINITPIASPMIAHGRYLKEKYGKDSKVVFIGPCAAKKLESENDKNDSVDVVITFDELKILFEEFKINPSAVEVDDFDDVRPINAQLFPLEGGLAKTAQIASGLLREDFVPVSGSDHVREMLEHIDEESPVRLFEALFCPGGCINGPCLDRTHNIYDRRGRVLKHHKDLRHSASEEYVPCTDKCIDLHMAIKPYEIDKSQFTEEQIQQVLLQTGKKTKEDELNCGGCGYLTCRDNAIAVLSGMAEYSMCLPWMRRLAERKADQIVDNSPNGILMLDSDLNIVSFNPAFASMFAATDKLIGKPISTLMDPVDFEKVAGNVVDKLNRNVVNFPQYGLIASVSIYKIEDANMLVGIFSNITKNKEDETRINKMKEETLESAQSVIEKQMRMAQEIASILGETTSETRVLLHKLTELAKESQKSGDK
ncbi:MAG: [Fe-Fe] hydrogenase large subunit C-terminal domain-containing protein [Armatimonadota bacterium]